MSRCELCQRDGSQATGLTNFMGTHYESCSDCHRILIEARNRIATLTEPARDCACEWCGGKGGVVECRRSNGERYLSCVFCLHSEPALRIWATDGIYEYVKFCPGCGNNAVGLGACDGRPGCSYCLRPLRIEAGEIRQVRNQWPIIAPESI